MGIVFEAVQNRWGDGWLSKSCPIREYRRAIRLLAFVVKPNRLHDCITRTLCRSTALDTMDRGITSPCSSSMASHWTASQRSFAKRIESLSTAKEREEDQNDRSVPSASDPGELVETIVDGWLGTNARSVAGGAYRNKTTGLIADVAGRARARASARGLTPRRETRELTRRQAHASLDHRFRIGQPDTHEALTKSGHVMGTFRYMARSSFAANRMREATYTAWDSHSSSYSRFVPPSMRLATGCSRIHSLPDRSPACVGSIAHSHATSIQSWPRRPTRIPNIDVLRAGDLASDLRAYLDGRAICARRASSLEHAWRWCRRNPAPAASALLVAASLITATVVSLWSGRQPKLALVQASEANNKLKSRGYG